VVKRQACKNFKLALIPEYGKISRDGGKLKQNFRIEKKAGVTGDLLLVDHGISASPRLCASLFFINDQFYQWNSVAAVVDKPVSL
jgi:hypothetical protein